GEFGGPERRNTVASWIQDDWQMTRRLTLNLGFRYDLQPNSFANFVEVYPILKGGRPNETTDFGPRAGFAYTLNDRTVIRGGVGRYYGQVIDNLTSFTLSAVATSPPIRSTARCRHSTRFASPASTRAPARRSRRRTCRCRTAGRHRSASSGRSAARWR